MAGVKGRSGGSNRKSIAEHKLEGTYLNYRHGDVLVPKENRELVVPQDHITDNNPNVNREEIFEYFAEILNEQGMTQKVDSIILSQLVEAQAMYVTALAYYKQDVEAVIGRKLASNVALEAAKEVRIIMNEFRLLPSSRTVNLSKGDQIESDPVEAFLNAKPVN